MFSVCAGVYFPTRKAPPYIQTAVMRGSTSHVLILLTGFLAVNLMLTPAVESRYEKKINGVNLPFIIEDYSKLQPYRKLVHSSQV